MRPPPEHSRAVADRTIAARSFPAIGTTALVAVTDAGAADVATALLRSRLQTLDEACSRFRADSELRRLQVAAEAAGGAPLAVSEALFEVLSTACDVARLTGGAVDPTVGRSLEALGYDRDYRAMSAASAGGPPVPAADPVPVPAAGWWNLRLDPANRTVAVPAGVHVDVGSSAKALAADRAAAHIARRLGTGVLVSLGGDVPVAGPPPEGGWSIGIAGESSAPPERVDQVVAVRQGGVASSAPGVRSWRRGGRACHHIVDPWTGEPVRARWSLASIAAPTCVEANALSTAAVVWGDDAVDRLAGHGRPARLVDHDGEVVRINGWPEQERDGDRDQAPRPEPEPPRVRARVPASAGPSASAGASR